MFNQCEIVESLKCLLSIITHKETLHTFSYGQMQSIEFMTQ